MHLVCGSTGAGKSAYDKVLSNEIGAIYFFIKGEIFRHEVTRCMFDFFEKMWEKPCKIELLTFKRVTSINGIKP